MENITSTHQNILEKHIDLTSNLSNTRNQFFDLNLLMQFPIIKHNGLNYIPYVPYIPYACTRSLMFRLTEENEILRRKIGKTVLEKYLEYLISQSPVTNKFNYKSEFKYSKSKKDSSDSIIYSDDKVVNMQEQFELICLKIPVLMVMVFGGYVLLTTTMTTIRVMWTLAAVSTTAVLTIPTMGFARL